MTNITSRSYFRSCRAAITKKLQLALKKSVTTQACPHST